jgi:hypothetical protein
LIVYMRKTTLLLALLVALLAPAAAHASSGKVIRDCADDGRLQGRYSDKELKQALKDLPADLDEYSDCREAIGAAIGKGGGHKGGGGNQGGGGGGGGGGHHASTANNQRHQADDAAALDKATGGGKPKLRVGGKDVSPGSNGLFRNASASHSIPGPLLAALIALGLLAIVAGFLALRRRIPALAKVPLPRLPIRVSLPRLLRR